MFLDKVQKNHWEQLNQLRHYIDNLEFESRITQRAEEISINILLVEITEDYKKRTRFMDFSFVPVVAKELGWINLLQFHTSLPVKVDEGNRLAVEKILWAINARMPIGYFGVEENGEVYLRYIYTTHRIHGINEEQLLETTLLFIAMLDMYEQLIDLVSSGGVALEKALNLIVIS